MKRPYFPLFVDISNEKILIIGGGSIATRRAGTLSLFAEDITVIAPVVTKAVLKLEEEGKLKCIRREYQEGDIEGAGIVLAATNNKELNVRIAQACKREEQRSGKRVLFNTADNKEFCDFYFPSVIKREEIVVGINSSGRAPYKVKKVREKLEKELE